MIESYLANQSAMRYESSPRKIRAAAKQMAQAGIVPAGMVPILREMMNAVRQS